MKIYQRYHRQRLNLPIEKAWAFFSSPYNLNDITPKFFNVRITSRVPERIYGGLLVSYRMKAILDIPMTWLSEVTQCDEPRRFVYQQRIGPFKFWSHEVCLTEQEQGIILEDIVFYSMPMGWLGPLLHSLLIADKLDRIFAIRRDSLEAQWGLTQGTATTRLGQ